MFLNRLGEGAENDSLGLQLGFKRGGYGDAIEHRIHGYACQDRPLRQGDTELFVGL